MAWTDILLNFGIPIFVSVLSILISVVKNSKVKKFASNILTVSEKAKEYIVEAEANKNYTGSEKKSYVITRLLKFIVDNSISNVDETTVSNIIENEVALTNEVNVEKKPQTTTLKNSTLIIDEPTEVQTSVQG